MLQLIRDEVNGSSLLHSDLEVFVSFSYHYLFPWSMWVVEQESGSEILSNHLHIPRKEPVI